MLREQFHPINYLISFALLVNCTNAFARGGPGGGLAAGVMFLLEVAVVTGLVVGIIHGLAFRHITWVILVALSIPLLTAIASPLLAFMTAVPVLVFIVVATVASVITRTVIPQTQASKHLRSGIVNRWSDERQIGIGRYFLQWIGGSFVFWAIVALFSFELLSFLVVPPALLIVPETLGRFLPFLLPPLIIAILCGLAILITYFLILKRKGRNGYIAPFLFNISVLISFLVSADIYRGHLMTQDLLNHQPSNLQVSLFSTSILQYKIYGRPSHASFVENGKTFRWSYSETKFVQVP